jgi:hypothetical protein
MPERVDAAESLDPIRYIEGELASAPDAVGANLIAKVDAGAQLVYALYHQSAEFHRDLPLSLLRAYTKACKAYGIGH